MANPAVVAKIVAESCLHSNKASSLEIRFLLTLPMIGLRGNRCLYCFYVCLCICVEDNYKRKNNKYLYLLEGL